MTTESTTTDKDAISHIKHVAQQRRVVQRMEDEIKLAKDNLKVAKTELEFALAGLSDFAEKQLAFRL